MPFQSRRYSSRRCTRRSVCASRPNTASGFKRYLGTACSHLVSARRIAGHMCLKADDNDKTSATDKTSPTELVCMTAHVRVWLNGKKGDVILMRPHKCTGVHANAGAQAELSQRTRIGVRHNIRIYMHVCDRLCGCACDDAYVSCFGLCCMTLSGLAEE